MYLYLKQDDKFIFVPPQQAIFATDKLSLKLAEIAHATGSRMFQQWSDELYRDADSIEQEMTENSNLTYMLQV